MRIEAIHWLDAHRSDGPMPQSYVEMKALPLHTVGWYLGENELVVAIAEEHYPEDERWRNVHVIPKVNILKRQTFHTYDEEEQEKWEDE